MGRERPITRRNLGEEKERMNSKMLSQSSSYSSLMATIIPTFLWGWPGEILAEAFQEPAGQA